MATATTQAYEAIWSRIAEGHFAFGERLKEAELVELCKVSRTPVREALRMLERDGLVQLKPNAGAVVVEWSLDELSDLYNVRARLEGYGARLAAERRTADDLADLDALAQEMCALQGDQLSAEARRQISQLNSRFHHRIAAAARSRPCTAASNQVIEAPIMLRTFFRYTPEALRRSMSDHLQICAAIRNRNGELAEALMRGHILAGLDALLAHQAQQAGETAAPSEVQA